MTNHEHSHKLTTKIIAVRKIQLVLSGFAVHLTSHFGQSFENHSYGYACSNDRPNCIASYTSQPNPSCNMRVKPTKSENPN